MFLLEHGKRSIEEPDSNDPGLVAFALMPNARPKAPILKGAALVGGGLS